LYTEVLEPKACGEPFVVAQAVTASQLVQVRCLFMEYARSVDFGLCFQSFGEELNRLPGDYAPPDGRLFLLEIGGRVEGCAALRKDADGICELKRVFVRRDFRGHGLGWSLVRAAIDEARAAGYERIRLDTIRASMQKATVLYRQFGFEEIPSYKKDPIPGVAYMELKLK
jgi:putative acetyltransferase